MTVPMPPHVAAHLPGVETITVVRAPLLDDDRYGSQRRDWTAATETPVRGCAVQPLGTAETDIDREYAATHLRLFAPYTIDLVSTDRVIWNGVTFEVDGEPARWWDDGGQPDHVEADVKRITG